MEIRGVLADVGLFAGLSADALDALAAVAVPMGLPGGARLIEQGGVSAGVWVLLSGRLKVVRAGESGPLGFVNPGESVGELSMISGAPHMAHVSAVRDSLLLHVPKEALRQVLRDSPESMWRMMQLLVTRTTRQEGLAAPRTLAVIALTPGLDALDFARRLVAPLQALGLKVALLSDGDARAGPDALAAVEAAHDVTLYAAGGEAETWRARALRQADRVLLLAGRARPLHPELRALLAASAAAPFDLALLEGEDAAGWRALLPLSVTLPVAAGDGAALGRLARLLVNRAVGIVLSGGGARGLAHLGVVKALRAAGVVIDRFAGVSMGSIVAAGYAAGWSQEEAEARFHASFVVANPVSDYTLPLLALTGGRKVSALLRAAFGERRIEALPHPYFCVSTNLSNASERLHREGLLWQAVRASLAIPGLLPPVAMAGEVLVDGAVLNNFPVLHARGEGRGPVIGVDVGSQLALECRAEELDGSGFRWLGRRGEAPGIASVLARSGTLTSRETRANAARACDLLLTPPVGGLPILDWRQFGRALEIGYAHASERIAAAPAEVLGRLGL
ncbi:patatin-like phospholipase family protein [Sandaracinobacteroides saxicola]|uniref:Patatin-like phospholipase family protein n=1 Tax=Sandaracinobacteroides saxicola TaxID=2759707 RepID=A0A7G5ILY1_9SPHN|nr:patatin-like phospholipase family protein [Sandaracinobacteroides saxicola]QMW24373.1 patatin-like phospholipase family protein [Sandaracinobacteroides saxicola]